jgi:hypothetical protein
MSFNHQIIGFPFAEHDTGCTIKLENRVEIMAIPMLRSTIG